MEAPVTSSSWMVCLHKGITDETKVLGDLRCEDKTQVGEAVLLLVTCNEEEITRMKKLKDVEYVEPNVKASLYPVDFKQDIHQETIQPSVTFRVSGKASHATKLKEPTKRHLPSVKKLDKSVLEEDHVSRENATFAVARKKSKSYLARPIEQSAIGHLEGLNECDLRKTGDDIWALSRIAQRDRPSNLSQSEYHISTTSTGKNVNVYILDSGIDTGHPEFRVAIKRYTGYVKADVGDRLGHGTAVASLVIGKSVGVASKANVIDVKVTENRVVDLFDLIKGLRFVIEDSNGKNNSVANISIAFPKNVDDGQALIDQIDECHKAGVTIVAAAGNYGASASDYLPAKLPQCITVACSTKNDKLAWYSNHGECVNVVAPGHYVKVADISGDQYLIEKRGTSFAAPIVSGVIARYFSLEETHRTPQEVADWLKRHCTPNKLAQCGDTPNLLVHASCSMTEIPCPRDQPQPGPELPPVPVAAEWVPCPKEELGRPTQN